MRAFKDIHLPPKVKGYPTSAAPRFSTSIVSVASGSEDRNQNWSHPLHRYTLAEAVREHEVLEAVRKHFFAMRGPAFGFPFLDPLDFASRDLPNANVAPTVTATDQPLGTGDGLTRRFQLVKRYEVTDLVSGEEATYDREITLPILATVVVALNGLPPETDDEEDLPGGPYTWTVSRPGGVVEFTPALAEGVVATAGFLFEVPVRFESDDALEGIVKNYRVSGFADLSLVELRPC